MAMSSRGHQPSGPHNPEPEEEEEEYDYLSEAVGSDYGDEEDDLDGERRAVNPDILYQHEFFYWLVMLIRGSTAGRKLKRTIFKLCIVLMVCTFPLMVIAYVEDRTFEISAYFSLNPWGAALHILMWFVAAPGFAIGAASLLFIRYWASLCTNRLLLTNFVRIYAAIMVLYLFVVTYGIAVLFLTFGKVRNWNDNLQLARIFPFYLSTIIFICPLATALLFYLMDISYFLDEIAGPGSVIDEPNPPIDVMDLSDVTASQLIMVICSFPFLIFIQLFDLCLAVSRAAKRYVAIHAKRRLDNLNAKEADRATQPVRKRSNVVVRIYRTVRRLLGRGMGINNNKTSPTLGDDLEAAAGGGGEGEEKVQDLRAMPFKDRELEERLARQAAEEEEERKRARRAAQQQVLEAEENARRRREEELRAAKEAKDMEEMRERERLSRAPTLDVPTFKDKWANTPAAGSFQCRLRTTPELSQLTDHMRNAGFHVVFASVPGSNECELGICNRRDESLDVMEPWFMARFLSSNLTFSAVMKAEDPTAASAFVKKFALAKVLKIDASSVPRSPKNH